MASTQTSNEHSYQVDPDPDPTTHKPGESKHEEDEFKITVKKLDTVVRPRGVLAE